MISSATVRQILVTWNIFSILDRQYTSSLGENQKVGNYRVYPLHAYKFNHSILKRSRCTCCICTVMPVVQRFDQMTCNMKLLVSTIGQNSLIIFSHKDINWLIIIDNLIFAILTHDGAKF